MHNTKYCPFCLFFRLALYVYEYLLHVGAQKSAQTFLSEVSFFYFWGPASEINYLVWNKSSENLQYQFASIRCSLSSEAQFAVSFYMILCNYFCCGLLSPFYTGED